MTWFSAFVGIGSNLNEPERQVRDALDELTAQPDFHSLIASRVYRSAPVGVIDQPDFINAVAGVLTQLAPQELLACLQALENRHGRIRGAQRFGPRTLDLDLLLYANRKVDEPTLTVPHPRLHERAFVLLPLADIAPSLVFPDGVSLAQRLASVDCSKVAVVTEPIAASAQGTSDQF